MKTVGKNFSDGKLILIYISKEKPPWKGPPPSKTIKMSTCTWKQLPETFRQWFTPPLLSHPFLNGQCQKRQATFHELASFEKKTLSSVIAKSFQEGIDYDHVAIDVVDVKEDEVFHIGHRYEICFFHFFRMSHL